MIETTGLVRALIQKGWVDEKTVEQAHAKEEAGPNGLLLTLIKSGLLDERKVAQFAAETFGLPVLDIAAVDPGALPKKLIDPQIANRYQVVALSQRKGKTVIAVADPTLVRVYDEIRFQTGQTIELVVAPALALGQWRPAAKALGSWPRTGGTHRHPQQRAEPRPWRRTGSRVAGTGWRRAGHW